MVTGSLQPWVPASLWQILTLLPRVSGYLSVTFEYQFRERCKDGTFSFALKPPFPILSLPYSTFISFHVSLARCFSGKEPTRQRSRVQARFLNREDSLEKEIANRSGFLPGNPRTQEPGGPQCMGSQESRTLTSTKQQQQRERFATWSNSSTTVLLALFLLFQTGIYLEVWKEEVGRGASRYPCLFLGGVSVVSQSFRLLMLLPLSLGFLHPGTSAPISQPQNLQK